MQTHGGLICDLGNVIIGYYLSTIDRTTFFTVDYNSIPEVPGAFDGLRQLADMYGGNVTICYNATDVAQQKISAWLAHHDFSCRTGIPMDRVLHSERGRDKTSYIGQSSDTHYGTTVVIDDRLEVLNYFAGRVGTLFLFRPQNSEIEQFNTAGSLAQVSVVHDWDEILRRIP